MFFKKKERLSREERIKKGYTKKYKFITIIIIILIFIFMSIITNVLVNNNKSKSLNNLNVPLGKQKAVYSSIIDANHRIIEKAYKMFPEHDKDPEQQRKYTQFVNRNRSNAVAQITEYFKITDAQYGKIYMKGYNENWPVSNQ